MVSVSKCIEKQTKEIIFLFVEDSDWQFAQKLQSEEQQRVQVDANQLEQQKVC